MEKLDDENPSQSSLHFSKALEGVSQFPLMQALGGRRSRRFCMGAEIPDGPLALKSNQEPFPLKDLEQMLLLTSMAGSTGWHYTISYDQSIRPQLPSFSGGPAGRTFPSAAGFHISDLFFTDDNGTYYFSTRDFHPPSEDYRGKQEQIENYLAEHKKRIRKLSDKRLYIPRETPYMDPHNTWIANHEGSTLVLPLSDLAFATVRKELNIPAPPPGAPSPFALADVETLKQLFSQAGFNDIKIDTFQTTFEFHSPESYTRAHQQTNAPINDMLAKYTDEVKNRVWNSITEAVWQYADSHGRVNLDNEVICIVGGN